MQVLTEIMTHCVSERSVTFLPSVIDLVLDPTLTSHCALLVITAASTKYSCLVCDSFCQSLLLQLFLSDRLFEVKHDL